MSDPSGFTTETRPAEPAGADAPEPVLLDVEPGAWLPEAWQPGWEWLAANGWLLVPLLVLLGWGIGRLLQWFIARGLRQVTQRTRTDLDDRLIELLSRPVVPVMVLGSLMLATTALALPGFVHNVTIRLLATVLLFVLLRTGLRAAHLALEAVSKNRRRFAIVEERTIPLFDMTAKILLVGAAAYLLLVIWGIDPTAWLASAGIIGIAVGFAAKDTLANLFSGIFIVADAPYKMGDYVVLDTGDRGMVTHIGMRSTRLLTRDDVEITIPNAVIGNAKIINESGGPWEKSRIRVKVGVAYGSDVDRVCEVLEDVARQNEDIIDEPAPRVRMRAFGDSALEFELMGWIELPANRGRVVHELMMQVYKRLAQERITIPFPQRDLHLVSVPEGLASRDRGGTTDQD
ncbi:MAG: mechanosensitive ion channel family protein [Xanthomonadales bacterium]|nr:mechanosensitive ion channel family protein [Xanthomonadales bacterium]